MIRFVIVYDLLGRQALVLSNERKPRGTHSIRFDAHGLATGIYLGRLQAGGYMETIKLLLIK